MHEFQLAEQIIQQILKECEKNNITKVEKIYIQVGTATGVTADSLEYCLKILAENTAIQDVDWNFEVEKAIISCHTCHYQGSPEIHDTSSETAGSFEHSHQLLIFCPQCSSKDVEILTGKSIILKRIIGLKKSDDK